MINETGSGRGTVPGARVRAVSGIVGAQVPLPHGANAPAPTPGL